jgi:hypothetical protein
VGKKDFASSVHFRLMFCKPHGKRKRRITQKGIFLRSRDEERVAGEGRGNMWCATTVQQVRISNVCFAGSRMT